MQLHRFETHEALAEGAADAIAAALAEGIAARGAASLVLPGGSTPGPTFDALSGRDLDWSKVVVTLNDERWIDTSGADSNERLVRDRLLSGRAAAARFVGLMTPGVSAREAVAAVEARLADVPRPFDVMLLGMGDNGHTASLFPGSEALKASLEGDRARVQAVEAQGARGATERMSLSLSAILDSRLIALLIAGEDKLQVLRRADGPGDPLDLPIRAVLQHAEVQVYWSP